MPDPLYERRELTRNVHIHSKYLQRNIHASLVDQLRHKYEGICLPEGYVQPRSITIVEHSLGRCSIIKGGLDYNVRFQADICMPHSGQVFRAPVTLKSKIGLHAESGPIKILLPRDLHIGNPDFDNVNVAQEIEFDVIGTRFQQGDESIVVLGKLRDVIRPAAAQPEATFEQNEAIMAAPVGEPTSDRKTVTVDVSKTMASASAVRRKKLVKNAAPPTNE